MLAVLLAVLALLTPHAALAQLYNPQVYPLSSCSSPTASLVTLGDASIPSLPFSTATTSLSSGSMILMAFNNSLFGAVLTQLTFPLPDNSRLSGPYHLRMGVFLVGPPALLNSDISMSLLGQTDEITVFPGGPQVVYANLLQSVQLLSGSQYAIGVWSDGGPQCSSTVNLCSVSVYTSSSSLQAYSAYPNGGYSSYAMPGVFFAYGPSDYSGNTVAIAASGCLDSANLAAPGTALYYMCAYTQQYTPAASSSDYTKVSTTTMLSVSGIVTVSTTASPTSFGSSYSVLSFSGTWSSSLSGQDTYYGVEFATSTVSVVATNTSSKLKGVTPSNVVYTSGAAAAVDTNGLSFMSSSGAQYVVQWNAATSQYQILSSATINAAPSSPILASGVTLSAITATSDPTFSCSPSQVYTAPTKPTCPSGYQSVYAGDFTAGQLSAYAQQEYLSSADGNTLYFRPFAVSVSGTLVNTLTTYLYPNPGTVLHIRLGLYALNGSITAPSWSLLSTAPEQVIVNSAQGVVEVPLPSAATLQPGTYSIGVWFDQPVYTPNEFWETTPQPFTLSQSYSSLSASGQLPSYVTPVLAYEMNVAGAQTCVPGPALIQFSFCAAFPKLYGQYDVVSGTLTAVSTVFTNSFGSYYSITGGNATLNGYTINLQPAAMTNPIPQRLYNPATTAGGVALDTVGLQLVYSNPTVYTMYSQRTTVYTMYSQRIPNTNVYQYGATTIQSYGTTTVNTGAGEFSYQPYTAGSPIPSCSYVAPTYLNTLVPASLPTATCSVVGTLPLNLGDSVLADYSNQKEGNSVPAMTVYTNVFTVAVSSLTVTQIAVNILSNTAQNLTVYMGVYSSTGALLGTSYPLAWLEVVDQQVVANLTAPAQLAAGSYYVALVADGPLNIATSTVRTPSFAVSSLSNGLPATISLTSTTAGALPLTVYGCASATHSLCALVQYYQAAVQTGTDYPQSTTYQYQGLLIASANSDGSATVQAASLHATALQRTGLIYLTSPVAYTVLSLAAPSQVYPNKAVGLDATGLLLTSASLVNYSLSYSSASGQYVDTWGSSSYPGSSIVTSSFTLNPIAASGLAVPSCSVVSLPSSLSSTPAPPTCSAGSNAVTLGDSNSADFQNNAEGATNYQNYYEFLVTSPIVTTNSSVLLSQIALGITNNANTVAKFRFAVYTQSQTLLGSTNEVTFVNPTDGVIVGVLTTPVLLAANATYLLAMWTDNNLYMAYNDAYNNWCGEVTYVSGQPFPASFSSTTYYFEQYCNAIPLAGLGCTVAASSLPSASSTGSSTPNGLTSTGSASTGGTTVITSANTNSGGSNDVSLSKGAVAGIVIGCVVGTNLLLLICLSLLCGLGRRSSNGSTSSVHKSSRQTSEQDPNSRVELATAEPSKFDKQAE